MNSKLLFPHGSIEYIKGKCLVLEGDDIDTDRIIPARYLKCVSFNDLGNQVFQDDRKELNGKHPFDLNSNKNCTILIVNDNFGCGSSREHAPQALMRWGIRAIIGQSFAEIFYGNCLSLGIPCLTSTVENIKYLQNLVKHNEDEEWGIDIKSSVIKSTVNQINLNLEKSALERFVNGRWDATSQLISHDKNIELIIESLPYLNSFNIKD